jgi:hypothetical protein
LADFVDLVLSGALIETRGVCKLRFSDWRKEGVPPGKGNGREEPLSTADKSVRVDPEYAGQVNRVPQGNGP